MPRFSKRSMDRLSSCHPDLQRLFISVIKTHDCSILCGHRSEADQEKAVSEGRSKVHFPDSRHNSYPSNAVDAAPYPIDWNDLDRFAAFAKVVQSRAKDMGIGIRWGGDWDGDGNWRDERFVDMPHFELTEV